MSLLYSSNHTWVQNHQSPRVFTIRSSSRLTVRQSEILKMIQFERTSEIVIMASCTKCFVIFPRFNTANNQSTIILNCHQDIHSGIVKTDPHRSVTIYRLLYVRRNYLVRKYVGRESLDCMLATSKFI